MLKFEKTAEIGDVIRAYDFQPMKGMGDCFVEGKVISKNSEGMGFAAYEILVQKEVFDGVERETGRVGQKVYVPFQVFFMEHDARVTKMAA